MIWSKLKTNFIGGNFRVVVQLVQESLVQLEERESYFADTLNKCLIYSLYKLREY